MSILLVEDRVEDVDHARTLLSDAGVTDVKVITRTSSAIEYLEGAIQGQHPLPKGILLDLLIGTDSGFEVLRFCHSRPELNKVPVVVWTVIAGDTEKQIAHWLGAKKYLMKNAGPRTVVKHLRDVFGSQKEAASVQ